MKNLTLLLTLFISILSSINAQISSGDLWCVAKNNAEDSDLQPAIDWACGPGGADCRPIQQGGFCFQPDDIQFHASYAFNDYFVKHGGAAPACDFAGTAALTSLDPGHGNCHFPSSSSSKNGNYSTGPTYGSTTGLGPSADLNFSSSLYLDRRIWFLTLTISIFLACFV